MPGVNWLLIRLSAGRPKGAQHTEDQSRVVSHGSSD
jgi:hypothetical protein